MRQLLLACCVLPCLAATATAHAILMESQPPADTVLSPGLTHVILRFNSRIDRARSRLELRHPGATPGDPGAIPGDPGATPGDPNSKPGDSAQPPITAEPAGPDILAADLPLSPGAWVLRWQVLAVDGHITRGEVPFTVRTP